MDMEKPYKILVVDDEADLEHLMRQRMRREIRSGQYTFVFAGNGVEALEKLNSDPEIDMVLSDINMPEMDGLTLLKQIPEVNPDVRAVVVSAYGDMENIRTAMNRGAFDFVTKPVDFDDLRRTIDRTLEHLSLLRNALKSRDKLILLENELNLASKMQQSILPSTFPQSSSYSIFGSMKPARTVGGDFFDVLTMPKDRVGIAVADVSGKGVPAALFMMSTRTLLKGATVGHEEPSRIIGEVNNLLCENNETSMFVTLFLSIFDPATGELSYVNGGHNPPLVFHADGAVTKLPRTGGIALGVAPGIQYEKKSINLLPNDTILLYSDGVTEAEDANGKQFGMDRLREVVTSSISRTPRDLTHAVFAAVHAFAGGADQFDDITCLILQNGREES